MSFNIAVAGKGGTGKTTISSLAIRHLIRHGGTPVLAVDADPNANLSESLGVHVTATIGDVIAGFIDEKINIPAGMTKETYLDFKLNGTVVENKGFDLISMGRGAGPECYCYPNHVLRNFMDRLAGSYKSMVLDNEAGMEHLSRQTTQDIDELLLVSDHSVKGVRTIVRLRELIKELGLDIRRQSILINQVPGKVDPLILKEMDKLGIKAAAVIPLDNSILQADLAMKSLLDLPDSSPAAAAVSNLIGELMATAERNKAPAK